MPLCLNVRHAGVVAAVIDGYCRDLQEIKDGPVSVFAKGSYLSSPPPLVVVVAAAAVDDGLDGE